MFQTVSPTPNFAVKQDKNTGRHREKKMERQKARVREERFVCHLDLNRDTYLEK